ncbi:cytochrome c1 [Citrobacter freundii]|uniref:cytochrome c1 n=1 Tax=Citrobacter freundii TaxID=546 RepID=UPI0015EA385E|nr:cytochrome c1 [Citrobacter freundii]MBA7801160.1 cytochrome c1 [Citrobacter freundii]QMD25511.1 cytochrome c1 [Citrobacter freundii]WFW15061.1 cytochrome c1 [Citrobacter freundii]
MIGRWLSYAALALGLLCGHELYAQLPSQQSWAFSGVNGAHDTEQLRRGLQVYEEKCRACHGMKYLTFKELTQPGGPQLTQAEAKALASGYAFATIEDDGQPGERDGNLNDVFASPYLNDQEAKYLNNGALPVDLSYIVRARSYDRGFPQFILDAFIPYTDSGADYIYALLTGYLPNDPEMKANRYFPGGTINMPKPLADGEITWTTQSHLPQTEEQYARDVTAFLAWVADPQLASRKHQGMYVMGYLVVVLALLALLLRIQSRSRKSKTN